MNKLICPGNSQIDNDIANNKQKDENTEVFINYAAKLTKNFFISSTMSCTDKNVTKNPRRPLKPEIQVLKR